MKNKRIKFKGYLGTGIQEYEMKPPENNEMVLKTEFSLISPGTELFMLDESENSGEEIYPGYILTGKDSSGKRYFLFPCLEKSSGCHCGIRAVDKNSLLIPLDENVSSEDACFLRFINIGLHAFNNLPFYPEKICVTGLGPVGNIACQTAQTLGYDVTGIDICPERLAKASECGIKKVGTSSGLKEKLKNTDLVIDTVVNDVTLGFAMEILRESGHCSMVGGVKPGKLPASEILLKIWQNNFCFKSGWEMLRPLKKNKDRSNVSTEENLLRALQWIKKGFYNFKPLITETIRPEGAIINSAYRNLKEKPESAISFLIDWR
jgi:threonine dehydrogenase-like Zn-dependent dehydrogenase